MTSPVLESEYEIRRVLARYAHAVDRDDDDMLRSCYHRDAIDEHMTYTGDIDGYIKQRRARSKNFRMRHHMMGAPFIEIDGENARVETCCTSSHIVTRDERGPERLWILWVRYEDRFEKRDGEWRIAHRRVRFEGDVVIPTTETFIPYGKREELDTLG
ncbi:MAG: nuclear transport factor 2 family protein [Acidimicrobiaceae bacterium]|nr:nuclear transport factor 2 family protein [Acidimicrobiaceae bacterium]